MTDLPEDVVELRHRLQVSLAERDELLLQQTATAEILKVINSSPGNLTPVFDIILEKAHSLCDVTTGSLELYEGDFARSVATRGMNDRWDQYLRNGYAITEGIRPGYQTTQPRQMVDMRKLVERFPDEPIYQDFIEIGGLRTLLALPLVKDGMAFGRIVATREEARAFTEKQISLLQSFADQAVTAIENARLFNETKEALERQTATAEVLQVVSSSMADAQPVLDKILESCGKLFRSNHGAISLMDDDGLIHLAANRLQSGRGDPALDARLRDAEAQEAVRSAYPIRMSEAARAAVQRIRHVIATADVLNEPNVPYGMRAVALKLGFSFAQMMAPLFAADRYMGNIVVSRGAGDGFSAGEQALLQTFADQAVIAIQNARLFDQVQAKTRDLEESLQQQTATAEVLKVISRSAFDLDIVLNSLTKSAVELCNSTYGVISLYRGAGCTPEFAELLWRNPARLDRKSVTGRAGLLRTIVQVPDVMRDEDYDYHGGEIIGNYRSIFGVPLLRNGELEGVFTLMRREPGDFTPRQVELVQTFADQAVIAIENVRLFDEVQARTKELAVSLDELRTAQDRLVQTEKLASLGQLTAGIAHEIKNPLNFVNNFSALSAELIDELDETLALTSLDQKMRGNVGELTQMLKSNLEKVVQHGKRADSIVKNMLLHSREGSGEHRSADINALVEESLNLAYHGARAEKPGFNVTLKRDLDPDAGAVELYPQEITRALLNLISNGFYAASQRKSAEGEAFEPVLIAATKNLGKTVEIRIRDNGTGIPAEVKEKIFNPFFTTKPTGEGTGLGLSMSYDIVVKQHGGSINVETEPGLFTEFKIVLPRTSRS